MNRKQLHATKARAMSNAANESATQPCLDAVCSQIQEAAQSGKNTIYFYFKLNYRYVDPKIIIKELKELGYKTSDNYDDNDPMLTISW